MHEHAVDTPRSVHLAVRRTTAMTATSRLLAVGSADRIIENPVVQFAMAVAVVTNTNAILVLNVSTDARVVKS